MKYITCFALLLLMGCTRDMNRQTHYSFYYWKTSFASDSTTTHFIEQQNIDHFYIHYFDVDWDDKRYMPVPQAEIKGLSHAAPFLQTECTPVIFITNRCFEKMDDEWCASLPFKIRNKIDFISNRLQEVKPGVKDHINEIQIDCDWTVGTKEKYFRFLRSFKTLYPDKKISVTIRLYPFKYPVKMGIPPADRGLLMCYNLTDIKDPGTTNSVFSVTDLQQYLVVKPYPLPLDIALPVFGWYAWFSNGRFKGIIYPEDNEMATADKRIFRREGNNFQLIADTILNNNYLRQGDELRAEYPAKDELVRAAGILHKRFPTPGRITLFYWDKNLIKKNEEIISEIYTEF